MSSQIRVSVDFNTGQWQHGIFDLAPHYADIVACLGEADYFKFENFGFGYELRLANAIMAYGVFPPIGVKFVSSDQRELWTERITLTPGTAYELMVWAQNAGTRLEYLIPLDVPLPPQPYPSWSWDGTVWQPPNPYPDDGIYRWDEAGQQWVLEDLNNGE
jgi:hypothetical protein